MILPLVVQDAVASRRKQRLIGPVTLRVDEPSCHVIVGPNGSGKTTFLRLLHGTARCTSGSISWAAPLAKARQRQAFVFQKPVMLRRSVLDNIAYPLRLAGTPRAMAIETARTWADRVGLSMFEDRAATVLSGGEQQKLALARALITQPEVLFLDEPCAALDPRSMAEVEEIMIEARSNGTHLFLATHDLGQARRMAERVIFLNHGSIVEEADAATFFSTPNSPQALAFLNGDIVQ